VFLDGTYVANPQITEQRPDVAAALGPSFLWTGFDVLVVAPPGRHDLCVAALGADTSVSLGCTTYDSHWFSPFGVVDAFEGIPGGIHYRGWAIDPASQVRTLTTVGTSLFAIGPLEAVDTVLDGVPYARQYANVDRPDVVRATGGAYRGNPLPRYGFDHDVLLPPGRHELCLVAIHQPYPRPLTPEILHTWLGCWTVTV
jgi:hypothetical protein